jgi:hypothetical protein
VRDGDVVVGGDAIVNFADIFADVGVALYEVHERVYAGRWAVCSERLLISTEAKMCFLDRGRKAREMKEHVQMVVSSSSSSARLSTMSP